MTTAWAHFVRGHWALAARANLGGTILAISAATVAIWALGSALLGRMLVSVPSDRTLIIAAAGIATLTLIDWAVRLSTR